MRLKIIRRPDAEIAGVSLETFQVGSIYEVGTQVACVFLAEGWAAIASDDDTRLALPSPAAVPPIEGVVLVVDDEVDVQRLARYLLVSRGYHVVVARHGQEAIDRLSDYCPDLIVLDLHMPVMDGWQFREEQRHLPKTLAAVPVLLLTSDDNADQHAVALQAVGVVRKPFAADTLVDAVHTAIGRQMRA